MAPELRETNASDSIDVAGPSRTDKAYGPVTHKDAIRAALTVEVVAFLVRPVGRTWNHLARGWVPCIAWAWFAGVVAGYLVGLAADGTYFWRAQVVHATPARLVVALRAYFISQPGKYVFGKAMVDFLRAGLVASHGVRLARAVFAPPYEPLIMIATGACWRPSGSPWAQSPSGCWPSWGSAWPFWPSPGRRSCLYRERADGVGRRVYVPQTLRLGMLAHGITDDLESTFI